MHETAKARPDVMISSTARDLPEHRKEVMDACVRQGMFPYMMEHLPALDADAIQVSVELVDKADIYIGVFAHRYGYVPEGHDISITEMEYNRAVERGIPRLIFLMDKSHPINIDDVEMGDGAAKLKALKARLEKERVVSYFNSSTDLRAHVINTLSQYRKRDLTAFHYVHDIPAPPEPYVAHPYTLLQSRQLVGRNAELNLLTDWVADPRSQVYGARILNVVAIGGMGKSALTWKWFNDIAPQEMKPLAGRFWWSFYESDATFENFIIRALAYVTNRSREDIERNTNPGEREDQLLAALDREPFLFVLDGLERILTAYARMDANRLADSDLDEETANRVAGALGLPESAGQSFIGQHLLRKTTDPRAGNLLRKLAAHTRASRILVTTRLYPADLQTVTGEPLPNCSALFLPGLNDDDALNLWRALQVTGTREELLQLFHTFGSHPLLVQAIASEVANYRRAPGDFDRWRQENPDFNPFGLPLKQSQSHVLAFALRGLDDAALDVLHTISAFRTPATYDTLTALLIGDGKLFADENALVTTLTELEDRGLLGWDRRANRYDLHPIVRGVVWSNLGEDTRREVYASLHAHFDALPKVDDYRKVKKLEDLMPAMELYSTLIGLGRYDDAERIFYTHINQATLYRLAASRQRIELLEMLFPDGVTQLPRLSRTIDRAFILNALAQSYYLDGQPRRAITLHRRDIASHGFKNDISLSIALTNLAYVLEMSGALREAEAIVRSALVIARELNERIREATSLFILGFTLAVRGAADESENALVLSLRILNEVSDDNLIGVANSFFAQRSLWVGEFTASLSFANRALDMAHVFSNERFIIRAKQRQGAAALGLNDLDTADERLHHALTRARMVNLAEEELPALVALAELRRRQGDVEAARELLEDVWEAAERGPYPLVHADGCNVLAEVERDAGNHAKAVEAATKAYELAWCDGPPFAYHWGLERARGLLKELGAAEPEMPPFDGSKFEAMPEVEIDPEDEFGNRGEESE